MKNKLKYLSFLSQMIFVLSAHFIVAQPTSIMVGSKADNEYNAYLLQINENNLTDIIGIKTTCHFSNTSAIIRNKEGKVAYYTNGCHIYNQNHDQVTQTSLQDGSSSDQYCNNNGLLIEDGAIFIPHPKEENKFYLLYLTGDKGSQKAIRYQHLKGVIIDTFLNVVTDHFIIVSGDLSNFAITPKGNASREYWLTIIDRLKNTLFTFEISAVGVQNISNQILPLNASDIACPHDINLIFSPDSKKMIVHHSSCYLSLYDFDDCTGTLVGPRLNLSGGLSDNPGSNIAFSQDGKFIIIGQETLTPNNIQNSTQNKLVFFRSDRVGISIEPEYSLTSPRNYSLGHIMTLTDKILVFNKFPDRYYWDINFDKGNYQNTKSKILRLPFKYLPSFSRETKFDENSINHCIDVTKEVHSDMLINLYPNPSSEFIKLESGNKAFTSFIFYICSLDGKTAFSGISGFKDEINLQNMPNGQYIFTMYSKEKTPVYTTKFTLLR